ncbi:hypothetical protein BC830DRAFT_404268 [Chytriomyces sp. MP71]|nr:hypothetical protein BC830DRAFT_404268 [Chytriomyces sp. MP71]
MMPALPSDKLSWKPHNQNMLSEYSHSKRWCFTVKSEPIQLRELLDACHPAPQLQLLDVFRTDGRSGAQIFSDPSFFEREWESVVRKERGERVARRQTRKHRHPTEEAFPVSESDVVPL